MGLWNWLLGGQKEPSPRCGNPSRVIRAKRQRAPLPKGRRLTVESLETRRLLDGSLTVLLAKETPSPHPTGDPPSATAQVITLTTYAPLPLNDPGIPSLEPFFQGLQQIYDNISSDPQARPTYWGEAVDNGGDQYEVHLCDNGMLVKNWTVNWGDGSTPQQVPDSQPWVVHAYAGGAGQYPITVSAIGVDGSFAAGAGDTPGALDGNFDAISLGPGGIADWSSHGNPNWASNGNNGEQTTNFESGSGFDSAAAVASDDGNILVAGTTAGGQFGLVRYIDQPSDSSDGNSDTSFGDNGLVTTAFSAGNATASALAVDPSHSTIVVAGTVLAASGDTEVALARYNDADGSPDTTFGDSGMVTLDLGTGWTSTNAVAVEGDGSILVAGAYSSPLPPGEGQGEGGQEFAVLHFNSDGTQDTSFGGATGGIVTVSFGGTSETPSAMAIDGSGNILVAGTSTQSGTGQDFALARFNADGTPDTSFGAAGLVTTDFSGGSDVATSLAIQANGQILLAGATSPLPPGEGQGEGAESSFALARYNTDGSLDTSFGTSGLVTSSFGDGDDVAAGVAVQANGSIVVCGSTLLDGNDELGSVPHFAVARYLSSGALDSSFGAGTGAPGGTVTTDFTALGFAADSPIGMFIDANGRLIVAGTATTSPLPPGEGQGVGDYSSFAVACFDPGISTLGLEVNDVPPVLQLSANQTATAGQAIDLSPLGRFTHAAVASGNFDYQIDWGDGSTPDTGTATVVSSGTAASPLVGLISDQHTYAAAGVYYVAVTINDPDGGSDTQSLQVTVNADPPAPSDPALLAAARQALGLPAGASVSAAQWASLISLTADSNQVLSLQGLQNAVNLQSLTLVPSDFSVPGHLADLSPLISLTQLKNLTLQDCGISNAMLTTLPTTLTALTTLDLRYNSITTVPSQIASLPKLTNLFVYGNPLHTSPVSGSNPTPMWCAALAGELLTVDIAPQDPQKIIENIDPANPTATYAALAADFYNLPIEIYQYLVNTIQYQPYGGAMKGPLAVLESGAGNDMDTDWLLANILAQISPQIAGDGISTSYYLGQIQVPEAQAEAYVGATDPQAAVNILTQAGQGASIVTGAGGATIEFEHTWLNASITTPAGSTTLLLDPSWKFQDFQTGTGSLPSGTDLLTSLVSFDSTTYVSTPQTESAAEFYEAQVRQYLAESDPSETVADVAHSGPIQPQTFSAPPTALPYTVASSTDTYSASSTVAVGTYLYDSDGRLSSLDYTHTIGGTPITTGSNDVSYNLEYDAAGNITQQVSADATDNYGLDNSDQLQSASLADEGFSHDQNGNRTGGGYVTGADNELLSDGAYTYQYDKDGNRIERTQISSEASNTYFTLYRYDYENRLIDVIFENNSAVKTGEIQYTYDYAGRLIRTATDSTGSGEFTYAYTVYDDQNPYLQVTDPAALANPATNTTVAISQRYLYGPAVDQILATDNGGGSVLWGLGDNVGTIRDVVDNSGTDQNHVEFDAFGAATGGTSVSSSFSFGLNGMRYDRTTGLYQTQTVPYDPTTGQRLSQDPIGFASGTTNFTAWAGNNPVQNADPSGRTYYSIATAAIADARAALQNVHDLQNSGASAADVQAAYAVSFRQARKTLNGGPVTMVGNGR